MNKKLNKIFNPLIMFIAFAQSVFAEQGGGTFGESQIAEGTKKLITDVTNWALVIAPLAGIICVIYFFIRRGAADETDQRKWNNRIVVAIVSTIGAVLATSIISLVTSYYT
jgi:Na+/H+ antiporter NhaA